jgi:high-affinity K+ transport system ATPase subunit B
VSKIEMSKAQTKFVSTIVDAAYELLSGGAKGDDFALPWVELFDGLAVTFACYASLVANGKQKPVDDMLKQFKKVVLDTCKSANFKVITDEKV